MAGRRSRAGTGQLEGPRGRAAFSDSRPCRHSPGLPVTSVVWSAGRHIPVGFPTLLSGQAGTEGPGRGRQFSTETAPLTRGVEILRKSVPRSGLRPYVAPSHQFGAAHQNTGIMSVPALRRERQA